VTADPRRSAGRRPADGAAPAAPPASPAGDSARSAGEREADHAQIDRLADELVPALIAKLSATGLGEIEVGEGDWTVRVRRPADGGRQSQRAGDRGTRAQPGHAGHGHTAGGFEGHRLTRDGRSGPNPASSNGSAPPVSPATAAEGEVRATPDGIDLHRVVATSPTVGIFQPRAEARTGTRVRAGDRLAAVDLLGVPQEVVAPADGIVGATLAEPGEAVEYGQELIVIELAGRPAGRAADSTTAAPADRTA
jgi:biotin carboxyl carrier protein